MSATFPEVTLPDTEVRLLSSSIVEQEFKIHVALPRNYNPENADTLYPVLYALDANGEFGLVAETVRLLQIFQEIPEILIVGIGYPVSNFIETLGLRSKDLTPTADDGQFSNRMKNLADTLDVPIELRGTGGANLFLRFIRTELMPFICANYRASSEKAALYGHSLGGLFALYTLFHQPDTFSRYIIGSPSIQWDDKITLMYEANYAASNHDLPAKIFMAAGALEEETPDRSGMVTNMQELAQILHNRNYENLALTTTVFSDETHLSVIPCVISRGLKAVLNSK